MSPSDLTCSMHDGARGWAARGMRDIQVRVSVELYRAQTAVQAASVQQGERPGAKTHALASAVYGSHCAAVSEPLARYIDSGRGEE